MNDRTNEKRKIIQPVAEHSAHVRAFQLAPEIGREERHVLAHDYAAAIRTFQFLVQHYQAGLNLEDARDRKKSALLLRHTEFLRDLKAGLIDPLLETED